MVDLESLPLEAGTSWALGAHSSRRTGDQGEVLGTRTYRPGDSLRHVHWIQTARHGHLIVAERQAPQTMRVHVIIDTNTEHHVGNGSTGSLESAIRIGASICRVFVDHDIPVDCYLGVEVLSAGRGRNCFQQLGDGLASWHSQCTVPSFNDGNQRARLEQLLLKIIVTTDLRPSGKSLPKPSETQWIVVLSVGAMGGVKGPATVEVPAGVLLVDDFASPATQFKRLWERECCGVSQSIR
jgi:uncharacterized protein (DUF58 family)